MQAKTIGGHGFDGDKHTLSEVGGLVNP